MKAKNEIMKAFFEELPDVMSLEELMAVKGGGDPPPPPPVDVECTAQGSGIVCNGGSAIK